MEETINILLVDDRVENLLTLKSILEDMGHNLILAQSGKEALKALLKQDFALILLDVQMPGMDGFETAELIRTRERSQYTPIIFLTALDRSEASMFKGYEVGAVDFLFKPLIPEVLRFKVSVFVDLFRKTDAIQRQAEILEQRVRERTQELTSTNESLRAEILERQRAEEALQFLSDATQVLASSLDYRATLSRLGRLIAPYLADICIIDLVQDGEQMERLCAIHGDSAREQEICQQLASHSIDSGGPHPVANTIRTGQTQIVTDIDDHLLEQIANDTQHLAVLRQLGLHAVITVPITSRDTTLGVISMLSTSSSRVYGANELTLAEELGRRVALAIENARLYNEAQEALRIRDQFLSIASHELKTPITAMLGYAQLLERRAEREASTSDRDRKALRTLSEQANRLNRLIMSLLDLSRIQTGQFTINPLVIDLGDLARRVIEETEPSLTRHHMALQVPEGPVLIEGDELRLMQVVQNLVQNAIKYSPEGGKIEVIVERRTGEARLAVKDQGIGIPATAVPQLFTRFYRANNVDNIHISGMGLGLYVVNEIVLLHRGYVEVTSTEGAGSSFTICLPAHKPPPEQPRRERSRKRAART